MRNQELYSSHPSIVRSSLKKLNGYNINLNEYNILLLETESQLDVNYFKDSSILPLILCKYHQNMLYINGKHPFSYFMHDILDIWPVLIDFISFNHQTAQHLTFLKEFILEIFSSYKYYVLQTDIIDFLKERSSIPEIFDIIAEILNILPKLPLISYFSVSQKLLKLSADNLLLLDHVLTRFELGYPILEMSTLLLDITVDIKVEIALIFTCAYILGKSLDKSVCKLWINILQESIRRLEMVKNDYITVIKRIILWSLIKIDTDKTGDVKSLIEWCISGIGKSFELQDEFSYDLRDFSNVIFSFIGPIFKFHAAVNLDLFSFYFPENQISTIILGSLVFHSKVHVQCQALELLAISRPFSLSKISYFLYSCNQLGQETQSFLYSNVLPLLVSHSKDPFIVISSINAVFLLDNHANRILALYQIWKEYPRIWPKFRSILGETLQKWKLALVKDVETEKALSWAIRSCCGHQQRNEEDLMALIINGLSSSYFTEESCVHFLHGLNACVKENVLDLRAVWNVTLKPFLSQWGDKLTDNMLSEIIKFYGLIGLSSDNSESFQEFRQEILVNEVLPNLENGNLEIQAIASESLSQFPVDNIFSILNPIDSYSFSKKDKRLIEILITAESNAMGRGILKGDLAANDGDVSIDDKRLITFKKSITNSVKDEIKAGRMKSTRKMALSHLLVVDCEVSNNQNLLASKEISAVIKNMNMDSIWQLWNMTDYLESFWVTYLGKLYDNLDVENHSDKVSRLYTIISFTYKIAVDGEFQNSSSPQVTSNLLYCMGSNLSLTKSLALLTSACKLGIIGAYDLGVTFFDSLFCDLKDSSAKIIPEDFNTSRDVQIAALIVMSGISASFLSHEIDRKADFIERILLSDDSPGLKGCVVYYLIPKVLAEIADFEGVTIRVNGLWKSAILKVKSCADISNTLLPFYTSFRTFITLRLIDEQLMHEILEIGKGSLYGRFLSQSYTKSLTSATVQEYFKQTVSEKEKESEGYIHMMWIIISQCSKLDFFESICHNIQETFKSHKNSAEIIAALILVAIPINEHSLFISSMNHQFCQIIVELISSISDPKVLRVSCWALAKLFMRITPKKLHFGDHSAIEPRDFSRLNAGKSIIRLAFDKLLAAECIGDAIFLECLMNVNARLPRVNWSSLLERLTKAFPETISLALKFAGKHAFISESSSLALHFSKNIIPFAKQNLPFLVTLEGIGNLLLLAGFSKTDNFSFSPLISHTECIENLKSIVLNTFENDSITLKVDLSASLRTCFIDWKYPDLLGEELVRQIKGVFEDWLYKCPPSLSPNEIFVIRNLTALYSTVESGPMRIDELTSSWIWHAFSLQSSMKNVICLLKDCLVVQSPDILFTASSAFKTYLGSQSQESLECFLIGLLDALISLPIEQPHSILNFWKYGVLNVLHSLLNHPKYSLKDDEILGWGSDEGIFLEKEIMWKLSAHNSFSAEIKHKLYDRIKRIHELLYPLRHETQCVLSWMEV